MYIYGENISVILTKIWLFQLNQFVKQIRLFDKRRIFAAGWRQST